MIEAVKGKMALMKGRDKSKMVTGRKPKAGLVLHWARLEFHCLSPRFGSAKKVILRIASRR